MSLIGLGRSDPNSQLTWFSKMDSSRSFSSSKMVFFPSSILRSWARIPASVPGTAGKLSSLSLLETSKAWGWSSPRDRRSASSCPARKNSALGFRGEFGKKLFASGSGGCCRIRGSRLGWGRPGRWFRSRRFGRFSGRNVWPTLTLIDSGNVVLFLQKKFQAARQIPNLVNPNKAVVMVWFQQISYYSLRC